MTPDLGTTYLGLPLRTPLVASAGPLTGDIDSLRQLEAAGAAAVVLPSLFEEQVVDEAIHGGAGPASGAARRGSQTDGPPSDGLAFSATYVRLVERASEALAVPVIASLNGTTTGGWVRYARLCEDAGAVALELNVYTVAADFTLTGLDVERHCLELVAAVRDAVRIPLAVKIGPFFTALPSMARGLVDAGADGLVLFNRFYQPDIDVDTMQVVPRVTLSTSAELRLPLRWIGILHDRVKASLAASTGVHGVEDIVKVLLAGADVAMLTSALLRHGPQRLVVLEIGLREWLADRGYDSVAQLRGRLSQGATGDPAAYERAQYLGTLHSYETNPPADAAVR